MKRLVLASRSPRRKELLKALGVKYIQGDSHFIESGQNNKPPQKYVTAHALGKAKAAAAHYENSLILGADTAVVYEHTILGKPRTMREAFEFLGMLQGSTHTVYTGLALVDSETQHCLTDYEKTWVKMRKLNQKEIRFYLKSINPMDKAGAYAIQGPGSIIIERISGCYYNVMGLPVAKLEDMLLSLGLTIFDFMKFKKNNKC